MKTLNEMFQSMYNLLLKYLVTGQMTYLEQMYTRFLNQANIDY